MLPTFHWAYEKDVDDLRLRSGQRAKQLLDEAGYPDPDGDGPSRASPSSTRPRRTSSAWRIASVIARMLAEVGIERRAAHLRVRHLLRRREEGQLPDVLDADPRDRRARPLHQLLRVATASRRATTSTPAATACATATPRSTGSSTRGGATLDRAGAQAHLLARCRRSWRATCRSSACGTRTTWRPCARACTASRSCRRRSCSSLARTYKDE